MENNFLIKEENFHKLNDELEIKTNQLMKEVECVMKLQNHLTNNIDTRRNSLKSSRLSIVPKSCASTSSTRGASTSQTSINNHAHASLQRYNQPVYKGGLHTSTNEHPPVKKNNDIISVRIPQCITNDLALGDGKGMGAEGLIRFLRAKVKVLQDEVSKLQADYKKRTEEWHQQHSEIKNVEEDRNKWHQQAVTTKEQLCKQEQQCTIINRKLQQREMENVALRKEVESLRKEMKLVLQTTGSNEVRLNRCLEDTEKLKTTIKQVKQEEKEVRDQGRKKVEELTSAIKKLERQKMELIHGFKKQLQLIDNLKKQKEHLEAGRVIQFTEDEFLKLLDWTPDDEKNI